MLTVVDLFAGAGGLSCGLEASGWYSVAAVDNDTDAIASLRRNQARGWFQGTRIIQADIQELSARDLRPPGSGATWRPDLLAGGPPCQPFSSAGHMRALSDPRGRLFRDFIRLAQDLRPRFVLFENVAGLVTARMHNRQAGSVLRRIQQEFEDVGYACRFALLNAADYGAPQRRVRLYMIASRCERLPEFPIPTHSRNASLEHLPWVTLGDFLAIRPAPDPVDIVRPNPRRAAELAKLAPGTGLRAGGIVEANRPGGHWGYRQDCFVADLALPSRTIRAASTPDWLRLPEGMRRLTWQECAGLQGFPIEWEFVGTIASRFRQIGNAVQGDIGRAIGVSLYSSAITVRRARPLSAEWPQALKKRIRYTAMEHIVNGAHRRAAKERNNAVIAAPLV